MTSPMRMADPATEQAGSGRSEAAEPRRAKKLLMITYAFPPAASVGVHRSLKYCKYLPKHGWLPVVLTADPSAVSHQDPRLTEQIPAGVVVHRTFDLDPGKWIDRVVQRKRRRSRPAPVAAATTASTSSRSRVGPITLLKWAIVSLLTASPDSHVFWIPFAVFRGVRIMVRERIDVVYCSSPPHSSHLIAFILATLFRKPYVLDFRDPWLVNGSAQPPAAKFRTLLALETFAKRTIVQRSTMAIAVSEGESRELRDEFPDLPPERVTHITNGFDPDDAPGPAPEAPPSSGPLRMIHAGTIYSGIANEFLEALRVMVEADPHTAAALHVDLLGEISVEYRSRVSHLESLGVVTYHGMQPHRRTLEMILQSDLPLLLLGGRLFPPSHLPAKTFEYLQMGKPILAICREGELTDILRRSGLGIIASPDSIDDLVTTLRHLRTAHAAGQLALTPNQDFIRRYRRDALAKELASLLDRVSRADHPVAPVRTPWTSQAPQ